MSERKRPLAEADPNSEPSMPHKSAKEKLDASPGSAKATTADENAVPEPKFERLRRPHWDIQREKWDKESEREDEDDAEDTSDDDGDDNDQSGDEQDNLAIDSAHDNDPSWVWFMSKEGIDKYGHLEKQAANRDQYEHGMHLYNDFTAYGVNEVVDNWTSIKKFRGDKCVCVLYGPTLKVSPFLQSDYVHIWFQGDDSRGFAETISMVGKALLTSLYLLKNHKKSNPYLPENGGPKNISLILALFVEFVKTWDNIGGRNNYEETSWVPRLGKLAKDNGIEIKGTYKFQERTEKLFVPSGNRKKVRFEGGLNFGRPIIVDSDSIEDDIKYSDDYSVKQWKEEFKAYTKGHATNGAKTIGGAHYDLTKMSKADRRRYQSGGGSWGW